MFATASQFRVRLIRGSGPSLMADIAEAASSRSAGAVSPASIQSGDVFGRSTSRARVVLYGPPVQLFTTGRQPSSGVSGDSPGGRCRRTLAAACCTALLVSCGVGVEEEAQPSPAAPSDGGSSPAPVVPSATGEPAAPSPTASPPASEDAVLVVSDGIRLDRLENNGGRTLATLTNLNSAPVDVAVTVFVYTGGGDLPSYTLEGDATLENAGTEAGTGTVLLEEDSGQAVVCGDICSYALDTEVTATDENETTCTPAVCRLEGQATPTPSS